MARKKKSVYDQLRRDIANLQLENAKLVVEKMRMDALLSAISVVAVERTSWLIDNNSEIKWVMLFKHDISIGAPDPYFRFFDATDEMLYKTNFPNSILEEALGRLP